MFVTAQHYIIIVIAIIVLLALRPIYTRVVLKQGNKNDWMFLFALFLLPINWYTPTFITVTDCGTYTKEVLLFPGKKGGVSYSYGWHNYIINKSTKILNFEYVYYGDSEPKREEEDQFIMPGKVAKTNVVKIDFLFEPKAKSVSTKSSGATKTVLNCRESE